MGGDKTRTNVGHVNERGMFRSWMVFRGDVRFLNAKDAVYYLSQKALKAPEHFTRFAQSAAKTCCANGKNQRTDFQYTNIFRLS